MAKSKKQQRATEKRPRLVPRPVEGEGTPLPAETGWRLAFRLAQARGELLRSYHRGGRKPLDKAKQDELADEVLQIYERMCRLRPTEKSQTIYERINKEYDKKPKSTWAWSMVRRAKTNKAKRE